MKLKSNFLNKIAVFLMVVILYATLILCSKQLVADEKPEPNKFPASSCISNFYQSSGLDGAMNSFTCWTDLTHGPMVYGPAPAPTPDDPFWAADKDGVVNCYRSRSPNPLRDSECKTIFFVLGVAKNKKTYCYPAISPVQIIPHAMPVNDSYCK